MEARKNVQESNVFYFVSKEDLTEMVERAAERAVERAREILPRFYDNKEVCEILHISMKTLYTMVNEGKIQQLAIGGKPLYTADAIDNAVQSQTLRKYKRDNGSAREPKAKSV